MKYKGCLIGISIIISWATLFYFANFVWREKSLNILTILMQTFLYTGLFITAHDAMHGNIIPSNKKINDFIGVLAVTLYACFDYKELLRKHDLHHSKTSTGEDPDYHIQQGASFVNWYLSFMKNYLSIKQILILCTIGFLFQALFSVSLAHLALYWMLPSVLSSLQLFLFGTYLPHLSSHKTNNSFKARSLYFPHWLSFLACYHFGYHYEHHAYPHLSWWQLPGAKFIQSNIYKAK